MTRALGLLGSVLCISLIEGLWVWLLVSAAAEVAGQKEPPLGAIGLLLAAAWFGARVLVLLGVSVERRRWILSLTGLGLALTAATIQAGLVFPLQLIFGQHDPDYRGAGIAMLLAVAYLWARGLAAAARLNRERVVGHCLASAFGLAAVLVFLPLTPAVQSSGLSSVIAGFGLGAGALFLVQLSSAESRKLTLPEWIGVSILGISAVVAVAAATTGFIASGILGLLAAPFAAAARLAWPLAAVILIGAGYLAQAFADLLRWLGELVGVDREQIDRALRAAEGARPRFLQQDEEGMPGAPEFYGAIVGTVTIALFIIIGLLIFQRLVRRRLASDDEGLLIERGRADLGAAARAARGLGRWLSGAGPALSAREAIREHYRDFQTLLARAGLPRRQAETAAEYRESLRSPLPDVTGAVGFLTDAYMAARYADADEPLPPRGDVERAVGEVRSALREGKLEKGSTP